MTSAITTNTQRVQATHFIDDQWRPEGGISQGVGYVISWQRGPLKDSASGEAAPRNGAFVMDLIAAVVDRVEVYQTSPFACAENAEALLHLNQALAALANRQERREAAGTAGTWALDRK